MLVPRVKTYEKFFLRRLRKIFSSELDTLKEQIDTLKEALVRSHEQLTQAQAVNAMQAQAIQAQSTKLLEDRTHKHWWQFWK